MEASQWTDADAPRLLAIGRRRGRDREDGRDRVPRGAPLEQQALARSIFLRLTEIGEGTEETRRRVSVDELTPRAEQAEDVGGSSSAACRARLIIVDEGTVEVAHEALIRHWPTLRTWLDEDREGGLSTVG